MCSNISWNDISNGTCDAVPVCEGATYYKDTDNTCAECPDWCDQCAFDLNNTLNNEVSCSSCNVTGWLNPMTSGCVEKAVCMNSTYYNDSDNTCPSCPANCTTCVYNASNAEAGNVTCTLCKNSSWSNVSDGTCEAVPICDNSSYYNDSDNTCNQCPDGCDQCVLDPNNTFNNGVSCSKCNATDWLNSTSLGCEMKAVCVNATYYNNSDNTCPACDQLCSECVYDETNTFGNNVTCSACTDAGFYNASERICVERVNCTNGTYYNSSENACFECPIHCQDCYYDENNTVMHNSSCSSCVPDVFFNETVLFCELRSICLKGTYYNGTDNSCYDCPVNCSDCVLDAFNSFNNNVSCSACEMEAFFNAENKSCDAVPICSNGTYYNDSTNLCHECPKDCNNCSANASDVDHNGVTCFSCFPTGWFNPRKQNCTPRANCQGNTWYDQEEDVCLFCPYFCSECNYDDTNPGNDNITCLACIEEGFFYPNLGSCEVRSRCRIGTYYDDKDNSCYDCPYDCEECVYDVSNTDNVTCTSCEDNLHYALTEAGRCVRIQ